MFYQHRAAPPPPRKLRRRVVVAASSPGFTMAMVIATLLLVEFGGILAKDAPDASNNENKLPSSIHGDGADGIFPMLQSLLHSHPSLIVSMVIRIVLATAVMVNLDAFLKLVVTPALAASIIGAAATPLTFFVGQTLQPVIYSICFLGFDDKFIVACLEATGLKERLASRHAKGKWQDIKTFEKFVTRHFIKAVAGWCVGFAGLAAFIPIAGPFITAFLSGWVVAWDLVYVPLSGMGHKGAFRQAKSVFSNLREYQWFGFLTVLMEEIPLAGPAFHVYNVYRASFFLERLYLNGSATQGIMDKDEL